MIISVKSNDFKAFESAEYEVDLNREFEGYSLGDLIISGTPFDVTGSLPLSLEIAISKDGSMTFRSWSFVGGSNRYFHMNKIMNPTELTKEQCDTINGLFSGRIKFEGLKLSIGGSIQKLCPIDLESEEDKIGKKIYITD